MYIHIIFYTQNVGRSRRVACLKGCPFSLHVGTCTLAACTRTFYMHLGTFVITCMGTIIQYDKKPEALGSIPSG